MTGKRVVVPLEYFHAEGDEYAGVIHEWEKFIIIIIGASISANMLIKLGLSYIHYALGDKWWMIEAGADSYLVREEVESDQKSENTVVVLGDGEESVVDVNPHVTVEEHEESNLYMGNGARAEFL